MKTAFIITSAINVSNDYPLTYSKTRSHFGAEERCRQTIFTVNSILQATKGMDTDIWIVDISEDWGNYIGNFMFYPNVKFISFAHDFPEHIKDVLTHPNKSRCECTILSQFLKKHKQKFSEYDYVFKMSGRYFFDGSFDINIIKDNPDKILYKKYIEFEWQDSWGYEFVDRRADQGNNKLRQYSSVLFGWGKKHQPYFLDMFTSVSYMLDRPNMYHYDIETLGYFFSRQYADDIIETDWIVSGWDGASGRFVRY